MFNIIYNLENIKQYYVVLFKFIKFGKIFKIFKIDNGVVKGISILCWENMQFYFFWRIIWQYVLEF